MIRAANNVVLSGQTGNLEGRGAGSRSTVANQGETARASKGDNRADARTQRAVEEARWNTLPVRTGPDGLHTHS